MKKIEIGKMGEQIAEKFLTSQSFQTLTKNYRWRGGEVDLIMFNKSPKPTLVFVEVKTRTSNKFGEITELLNKQKRERLIKTAHHFLLKHDFPISLIWRIDLVAVKLNTTNLKKQITHFKHVADG